MSALNTAGNQPSIVAIMGSNTMTDLRTDWMDINHVAAAEQQQVASGEVSADQQADKVTKHPVVAAVEALGATWKHTDELERTPAETVMAYAHAMLQQNIDRQLEKALGSERTDEAASIKEMMGVVDPVQNAGFIVTAVAGFHAMYMKNHVDEEPKEALDGFMSLIRGAIDTGFEQAREALGDLLVTFEEVDQSIDETYAEVSRRLDQFYEEKSKTDLQE
uniref:DUF5610 domain-containing protein n=1 Tax=Magnetococcus massalia (strain MO-1) TaxID=451514 RepID=A0A1S7LMX8_MAGMO|nr:conserved protein of unknown function [Candidatus Magnetococcus massalia]